MWKLYLGVAFIFGGCSNLTFNALMCDKIASDPNAVIPQECVKYSEEEAEKAYNKTKDQKQTSNEEILKFNKEEK